MTNKKITIQTGGLQEAAKDVIDVWHRVEQGQTPKAPIEKISFKDQDLLFKTLTPRRFEILKYVHQQDGISIRALAKELGRDYSNVHQDVKILSQLGLMTKDIKTGKFYVLWDVIVTELCLPTKRKTKAANGVKETAYLLGSEKNAKRLRKSIKNLRNGKVLKKNLMVD